MAFNHIATVEGVSCDVYREVMQAERSSLYLDEEKSAELRRHYASGTFSEGRPMELVSELKAYHHTR